MRREAAPAPEAIHKGADPKMKANEVIRMGRLSWKSYEFQSFITAEFFCSHRTHISSPCLVMV